MKHIVEIDFETRSLVDLKVCGAGRYASDPSTDILCTCWSLDNGPVMGVMGNEIPEVFYEYVEKGYLFSAFNAIFEQLIWHYRWSQTLKMPKFMCTRSLCAAHGLPQGLDRACKALHIGYSKDIEGKRLINTYSKPNKEGGFNEFTPEDAKKELQYCGKDVILSRRIRQRLPMLLSQEQAVYDWTVAANLRGVAIDIDLAERAEGIAVALQSAGNTELAQLTGGTIFAVTQVERIKKYLEREYALETDSLDKESIEELLLQDNVPDTARRILELRRDLSQTSVKKFSRAKAAVCADGRVRDTLIYHGAGPGRWTSQVVQFQNLPKGTIKDVENAIRFIRLADPDLFDALYRSPMLALSACIRGLVIPGENEELVVVDYAQIEARLLNWAAGQEDIVEMFRKNIDIYIKTAEFIYQASGFTKEDNPKERFLGKTVELGCGYQMGFVKFQGAAESKGLDLGEKTECVTREKKNKKTGAITEVKVWYAPLAKQAIDGYRSSHPEVVKFWYAMQGAAEQCVRTGQPQECRAYGFRREREFMYMRLPSGREIAYHHPGIDKDGLYYYTEDSETHTYMKKRLYGGLLVENAIQGTARDILAHGILNLEDAGYKVILTVHDENVVSVKDAKKHLPKIMEIMCDLPAWAEGCPITAEGFVCDRYKKG